MKKELKAILIIGSILIAAAVSLSIILPYFKKQPTTTDQGVVRIYVNSTIADNLSTEIEQYEQDVINQGYSVEVINWSTTNVTLLRNDLINASLQPKGLEGAVLIGDLPAAFMQYYYF
ncbi:unnamed protein product, partial [marine sediment metagenome]